MADPAIAVENLEKAYPKVKAVDGVSFEVQRGEVFTLLGPNGAGKTTIVEILEGLKEPDRGTMVILGQPCRRVTSALKDRIGVVLQDTRFIDKTKVLEMIQLFASFFSRSLDPASILAKVALEDKAQAYVEHLSGGQRQRLAIGLALVNDPDIIFLDEPTTGLDPQARRSVWDLVADLRAERKTVFLTTHYMEEAEQLADQIHIMDHGQIIARGTPAELIAGLDQDHVIEFEPAAWSDDALAKLQALFPHIQSQDDRWTLYVEHITQDFARLIGLAEQEGMDFANLVFRRPNLEDVFLSLTGKGLRD